MAGASQTVKSDRTQGGPPAAIEIQGGPPPPAIKVHIRPMSQRHDWLNWVFLLGDWGYIACAITIHLFFSGPLVYILMLIVIGSRMRALANLTHEAAHFKLYRNRKVNNAVGRWLCAWPIFISYTRYIADHIPLMPAKRLWYDAMANRRRLLALSMIVLVIFPLSFLAPGVIVQVIVFCWIIPSFTTFQCISYWAELGEHAGLRDLGPFWGSRNWKGNVITRWLIGSHSDDLYHLLHHWFPTVPHYKLRLLDSLCQENWPEYQNHARCTGFFFGSKDGVSVLKDMWLGADLEYVPTST